MASETKRFKKVYSQGTMNVTEIWVDKDVFKGHRKYSYEKKNDTFYYIKLRIFFRYVEDT